MDRTPTLRFLLLCAALLCVACASSGASPRTDAEAPADWSLPLGSRPELDAWVRDHAGRPTPFDALPAGARERFLLSLRWGSRGLGSFDPDILADELPQPQIDAILRLFGDAVARHAPRSRAPQARSAGMPPATDGISPLERRYNDFYRSMHERHDASHAAFAARVGERFDALLADAYAAQALRNIDDRHLAMLWNAADQVALLTLQSRHVEALEAVFAESRQRSPDPPSDSHLRTLRNVLLASQRFADARRLTDHHPAALSPLPEFIAPRPAGSAPAHAVWRMSADGSRLTAEPLDLSGTRILVTAGCHFSVDAAADIADDPLLGPAFAEHAAWLMLPPGEEDIDAVRQWNRRFPRAPALMVADRDAWPMPGDWPMPQFHLLRDGRILETVTGWPGGAASQRGALVAMLRRAGLLDAASP